MHTSFVVMRDILRQRKQDTLIVILSMALRRADMMNAERQYKTRITS